MQHQRVEKFELILYVVKTRKSEMSPKLIHKSLLNVHAAFHSHIIPFIVFVGILDGYLPVVLCKFVGRYLHFSKCRDILEA